MILPALDVLFEEARVTEVVEPGDDGFVSLGFVEHFVDDALDFAWQFGDFAG